MKFTQEDYKNLISEQEKHIELTNDMKLTLAEQQAIIYEDYDAVKRINEKRLQLQEQVSIKPKQKKNSSLNENKNVKINNKKSKSVVTNEQENTQDKSQKDITIMGLTALISKLRAKRRDRIQKNQSTTDIDNQIQAAMEKKKQLQGTK